MEAKIFPKPSHARCYKCGSTEIEGICHHCGRGMCSSHANNNLPSRVGFFNALLISLKLKARNSVTSGVNQDFKYLNLLEEFLCATKLARISNPEFAGYVLEQPPGPNAPAFEQWKYKYQQFMHKIGLFRGISSGMTIAEPFHCEYCVHSVSSYTPLFWWGIILFAIGVFCLLVNAQGIAIFGIMLGIGMVVLSVWLNKEKYIEGQMKQIPSLVVDGTPGKIQVNETISGSITLTGSGKYFAKSEEINGSILIPIRFDSKVRELHQAHLRKLEMLNAKPSSPIVLDAGYLIFGANNWNFHSGQIWMPGRRNIVKLFASTDNNPFQDLLLDPEKNDARWEIGYGYNASYKENEQSYHPLPLQIVISIRPESQRRALDIELELMDLSYNQKAHSLIDQFSLLIPNDLGKVERVDPEGKIDESASERPEYQNRFQMIKWKNLEFKQVNGEKNPRRAIYIQFCNEIDEDAHLEGDIDLSFPGTLSISEPIRFFSSSGRKYPQSIDYLPKTKVHINLDLDLSGLRYQNLKVEKSSITRFGITPDSNVIAQVVDTLSEEWFYIKRITENPPKSGKEGAHKTHRLWDMAGRKYDGVYPIDFHLVLTGEEVTGRSTESYLKVEITVQGDVTQEEMSSRINNVIEQLSTLICTALDKVPLAGPLSMYSPRLEAPKQTELPLKPEDYHPVEGTPVQVIETDNPNVEILKPFIGDEERLTEIQRRIDLAEKNLLEGKISEGTYYLLKAKYEQELWEMTDGRLGKPASSASK